MTKRMLIDSAHPEETRVVLLDGNQLEDFDVEVSSRRQLKGNIYLAKVIRVEPSLQAAFVDYGGNRHGFLAFSEIHPDYYQIPVSDRPETIDVAAEDVVVEDVKEAVKDEAEAENADHADDAGSDDAGSDDTGSDDAGESKPIEVVGGDDSDEIAETQTKRHAPHARRYKIQEVIKRRQVLLIQVVKEERGNKGAALTTYMSLAGRYCVLMPNTERGGGISRKITNSVDRKALKAILSSLDVPEGMAVILRTAGIGRTKAEIKRDFEYLIRLWNNVRDLTLKSTAPSLVHEEGDIVRRSIRDLYSRDIEEVQVQGEAAYKAAKEFMKLLIPSHARRVKHYKDADAPLLRHYGVENQMDAMHNPIVHLPSGGYLVINPTEALVSVDVNSGKSTKERNIEETAVKTNLEAADSLARQLRLRDLAGLVVIDFIDMDLHRNNAQVERRMKEALKNDRARIQVGRISPFGLLEMSRQRLRPSLIETSSEPCPYCAGTGIRRSTDSTALVVLRAIDEEGAAHTCSELTVHVPTAVALYILNNKRDALAELEKKHGFHVILVNDDSLIPPDLRLERTKSKDGDVISEMVATQRTDVVEDTSRKRRRRRGGRNRNNNSENANSNTNSNANADANAQTAAGDGEGTVVPQVANGEEAVEGEEKPKRRRSRRGGRRRGRNQNAVTEGSETQTQTESTPQDASSETAETPQGESAKPDVAADGEEKPKRRRPRRRKRSQSSQTDASEATPQSSDVQPVQADANTSEANDNGANSESDSAEKPKPRRTRRPRKKPEAAVDTAPTPAKAEKPKAKPVKAEELKPKAEVKEGVTVNGDAPKKPKRKGWWNLGS